MFFINGARSASGAEREDRSSLTPPSKMRANPSGRHEVDVVQISAGEPSGHRRQPITLKWKKGLILSICVEK